MKASVDFYRSDVFAKVGTVALADLLCDAFEPALGRSLVGAEFELAFLPIGDLSTLDGRPALTNLRGSHAFAYVRIRRHGSLLYQHPHSVREIIGRPLQRLLALRFPDETDISYSIVGCGLDDLPLVRPKPVNEGTIVIRPDRTRTSLFHLEEIPDPEAPVADLREFGIDDHEPAGPLTVVLTAAVHEQLQTMSFSADVEEGGFLAGKVFREAGRPERHLVLVTAVLAAESTGASLLHFTFTGDSFLRISEALAQRGKDERLVGWYHTHLFPATDAIGLSTIDIELHRTTFRRPWQVAGLINISGDDRLLRFYCADEKAVQTAPHVVSAA